MLEGLAALGSALGGIITNYQNAKYADKANRQQADLLAQQNAFNSAEAEKQRQWETTMSNTAYQRAREDMEAAGINPILLGSSAQAASTPVGASADSAASHAVHRPNVINFIDSSVNSAQRQSSLENQKMNTIINALGKAFG